MGVGFIGSIEFIGSVGFLSFGFLRWLPVGRSEASTVRSEKGDTETDQPKKRNKPNKPCEHGQKSSVIGHRG